jgi:predicted nucleotide-binding protein
VEVGNWLHTIGAQVERVGPGRLRDHLSQGLVDNITPCGSILAICTADDVLNADGSYHPRQNVMVEIGMALALYKGHERLIIMQQRASADSPLAVLPTDLDGLLTIPFTPQKVSDAFPLVARALRERGFPMQGYPAT